MAPPSHHRRGLLRRRSHGGQQLPRCQSVEGPGRHGTGLNSLESPGRRGAGQGLTPGGAWREGTCIPDSTEAHGAGPLSSLPVGPTGTRPASAASCAQEPPGVCKAPKAPPKPMLRRCAPGLFHPAGPHSSGQTTSGSEEAIPLCPVASLPSESDTADQVQRASGGENAGPGRGRGLAAARTF